MRLKMFLLLFQLEERLFLEGESDAGHFLYCLSVVACSLLWTVILLK